jgi:catechol 2,3-dioxygenase-like lactoylglutathione lyase family enzyme
VRARSFSHTGITVSDFNRAVKFWWQVFGCPLVGVSDAPADRVAGFFGVPSGGTCRIGWIRIPGGSVIEIFHFEPQLPPYLIDWNRRGLTHICLNVRGIHRWHDYLSKAEGVEIVCPPELHVLRARMARPARRLGLQTRDVQQVLRRPGWSCWDKR